MKFPYSNLTLGDKYGVSFGSDETVKLICNPNLKSALLNYARGILIQFGLLSAFLAIFYIIAHYTKSSFAWGSNLIFLGAVAVFMLFSACWAVLRLKKTTYIVTNVSLIIHHDFFSSTVIVISLADIKEKKLIKTFVDKHFDTGTIKIFTGKTKDDDGKSAKVYDDIAYVVNPHHVLSLV